MPFGKEDNSAISRVSTSLHTPVEQETSPEALPSQFLNPPGLLSGDGFPAAANIPASGNESIASNIDPLTGVGEVELTAQQFLDTYAGGTIPEGVTVKIQDDTAGSFLGDFILDFKGKVEFGENVSIDVSGAFKLDGKSSDEELLNEEFSPPGSQLQVGENNVITAGTIELGVNGNLQIKMNNTLTAEQGDLIIEAGSQIQLEENISLHASEGSIKLDASEDGDVQIKKVESELSLPNISAGDDIIINAGGDIQILDGNTFSAGDDIELMGTSEEGDIEIAPVDPTLIFPSIKAGGDIHMETNGDIQIMEGNTLYAGGNLKLKAKSEGDVQILQVDTVLPAPRLEAGEDVIVEAEGDINFQRGDTVEVLPYPDIKAGRDILMTANGEVEIEPGNWLKANRTIQLQTIGVEVQVQPRANVTLEAGLDILLLALEENAGITVGENATLKAGNNITLQSGHNDQGEGDTRVKENSTLTAGNSIIIESGLNGQSEVKENNILTATNSITIESGVDGQTIVKGDGTTLTANVVTIKTVPDGECVVEPDVAIYAATQNICPDA